MTITDQYLLRKRYRTLVLNKKVKLINNLTSIAIVALKIPFSVNKYRPIVELKTGQIYANITI